MFSDGTHLVMEVLLFNFYNLMKKLLLIDVEVAGGKINLPLVEQVD